MKVIDFLTRADSTLFSYEIIPPKRGGNIQQIFGLIDQLLPIDPPFIDITSRAAEVYYEKKAGGLYRRHAKRKRPGTIGLCAAIKNRYNIEAIPHLLCRGFTCEETEDALIELNYLGIHNVLAVTGDDTGRGKYSRDEKARNQYANQLVEQTVNMNRGIYLEELEDASPTNFCIGVGGYPEKHIESPNWDRDIQFLKNKILAGAHYIVTQMFFDNSAYFRFVDRARKAGISVPLIAGIKIITRKSHLSLLPKTFHVQIPEALTRKVMDANPKDIRKIGVDWALKQCQELIDAQVPCIHFFIMHDAKGVAEVVSKVR
ncbi:MAG: methylenetetrahydrofolate reductase [Candidatus Marinimicrobia bacterium]|nr:methylenetetrahydrofolate reductase [Candidatus Neomarinimicrobiota bacterium]MBL7046760.1 methylenetetrahydrofolate reductase [Candidatus Neomarinimicrobiota bacterium]